MAVQVDGVCLVIAACQRQVAHAQIRIPVQHEGHRFGRGVDFRGQALPPVLGLNPFGFIQGQKTVQFLQPPGRLLPGGFQRGQRPVSLNTFLFFRPRGCRRKQQQSRQQEGHSLFQAPAQQPAFSPFHLRPLLL